MKIRYARSNLRTMTNCTLCKLPLVPGAIYSVVNDKPYHSSCASCSVCKADLKNIIVTPLGQFVCSTCITQYNCNSCMQVVPSIQVFKYGNAVCRTCLSCLRSSVTTPELAKLALRKVLVFYRDIFGLSGTGLADLESRIFVTFYPQDASTLVGEIQRTLYTRGTARRLEYKISCLCGLSSVMFEACLVHEVRHALFYEADVRLSNVMEEGFCELASCLYICLMISDEKRLLNEIKRKFDNCIKVYAEGIRTVTSPLVSFITSNHHELSTYQDTNYSQQLMRLCGFPKQINQKHQYLHRLCTMYVKLVQYTK